MSFVFYDGDRMSDIFEKAYLENDLAKLKLLSASLDEIHSEIADSCQALECRLIEFGGDQGIVECLNPEPVVDAIKECWASYGLSVSVGQGDTPAVAYLNTLHLKKLKETK